MRFLAILTALSRIVTLWSRPDRGVRLVAILRGLDGAWLKIGQTASFRRDLLPDDVCDALRVFQGQDGRASLGIVRREGDRAIKEIPVARVQLIAADLWCVRQIARGIGWLPVIRRARLSEMVDEVSEAFARELDLRMEGASQRAFRRQLAHRAGLYVPKVFASQQYRLEMEFIEGEDLATVIARGEGPRYRRAARRLLLHLMRMMLEDNRFHGDLHAGNVRVMRDGRLALLDFGCVGLTDAAFLRRFRRFVIALDDRDWRKAANEFAALQCGLVPRTSLGRLFRARRLARVEHGLIRVLDRWVARCGVSDLPFRERSLHTLIVRMVGVTAAAGGHLNAAWLSIQRALQAVESVVEACWPRVDYLTLTRQYVRASARRQCLGWMTQLADVIEMAHDYLDTLTNQDRISRARRAGSCGPWSGLS